MTGTDTTAPNPALGAVQRWMLDALRFPGDAGQDETDRLLAPAPRLTGTQGLAVYQRGYFLRIASCLREQFPALCHALGQDLFDDFVADYIHVKPPESHTLYDLGRRFPAHLEETRPDRDAPPDQREVWVDFMIDLAHFERQVFVLFDAPGHEGHPFANAATPDRLLRLQPAFGLGAYRFPVPLYYHDVRQERPATLPPRQDCFVALARVDYVTHTLPIHPTHHLFLTTLAQGGTVADGIDAVAHHLGQAPEAVRRSWQAPDGIRQRWLDAGFFIAADTA